MGRPSPNTSTPLGRLLADLDMTTGEFARALGAPLTTVLDWRSGRNRIMQDRVEQIAVVLATRGADAGRVRETLVLHSAKRKPRARPMPSASWGGGMPYDWFLARRIEAEGFEEAA